jgi:CubicO group peptidase (beta-lactamase class C family)
MDMSVTEYSRPNRCNLVGRLAALLTIGLGAGAACADPVDEQAVLDAMASRGVPGVAIAVVRMGEVDVFTLGSASPDTDIPVTAETTFEAASLSKTVFAAMFIEAVANGHFSLDKPLADARASRRVTNDEWYGQLTPRLILSHQTGLPNWAGDARDPARTDPLEFKSEPGAAFGYSGEGYELLHADVVATLDRPLEDWLDEHRDAYGMANSHYVFDSVPSNAAIASGNSPETTRAIEASPHALAAASLITTASDYGHFVRYLLQNPDLFGALTAPQVNVEQSDAGVLNWGLGWGLFERPDGSRIAFHWGDNWQFKSFVAIDEASDTGIVYFANGVDGLRLIDAIVEPVIGDLGMVRDWLDYEED